MHNVICFPEILKLIIKISLQLHLASGTQRQGIRSVGTARGFKYREWVNIWYLCPEKYRVLLERMKAMIDSLPEDAWARRIVMIDNWNEWDEGHFVAPSHKFGFKYLQAIREVFTKRNNLPDYFPPHDQGFTGDNKSWGTPDFKEFC